MNVDFIIYAGATTKLSCAGTVTAKFLTHAVDRKLLFHHFDIRHGESPKGRNMTNGIKAITPTNGAATSRHGTMVEHKGVVAMLPKGKSKDVFCPTGTGGLSIGAC